MRQILILFFGNSNPLEAVLLRHVFLEANRYADPTRRYCIEVRSADGRVEPTTGFSDAQGSSTNRRGVSEDVRPVDTLVICAPSHYDEVDHRQRQLVWLERQCLASRRIVGVAGGVLHLAALQLLSGRDAALHWKLYQSLRGKIPGVNVRSDVLFTQDRDLFTCAGALASVDLGLHLVEDDLGSQVASHVAQQLIIPYRRTPICKQISITLQAQGSILSPIADLVAWLPHNLNADLSIPKLARQVAMSPRNFARRFREQVKRTPARYIEDLRLEAAMRELALENQTTAGAIAISGVGSIEGLRRLFQRRLGVSPKAFRERSPASHLPGAPLAVG